MQGRGGRGWGSECGIGLLFILLGCFFSFFFLSQVSHHTKEILFFRTICSDLDPFSS